MIERDLVGVESGVGYEVGGMPARTGVEGGKFSVLALEEDLEALLAAFLARLEELEKRPISAVIGVGGRQMEWFGEEEGAMGVGGGVEGQN